jgi:hypothetical protein
MNVIWGNLGEMKEETESNIIMKKASFNGKFPFRYVRYMER